MDIVEFSDKIHHITDSYRDLIGREAESLASELAIDPPEKLRAALEKIDKDGRVMKIGMVGRVKSGKSSLLNALLFDGEDILPKAATPMTAALTVLSYGDEAAAEAEYYSDEDIAQMKASHERHEAEINRRINEEISNAKQKADTDKIRRRVEKEMRASNERLAAISSQYVDIRQHLEQRPKDTRQRIQAEDLDGLKKCLADYVGAGGKLTPFTKSITLRLPLKSLCNLDIVDTPGINDPISSREARTHALLKECDLVFMVSPSGQFMSHEDIELMDRISMREGINEIFVVNSKVDDQLHSKEEVVKHGGALTKVLQAVNQKLADHAVSTLKQVREHHPEVGACYDKIINDPQKRVMHSSSICFAMTRQFTDKAKWDDGQQHAWKLLTQSYPDFFPAQDPDTSHPNLEMLAGIKQISASLEDIRQRKTEIMQARKEQLSLSKIASLSDYQAQLITAAKERQHKIRSTNLDDLAEQLAQLKRMKQTAGGKVDAEYDGMVEDLTTNLRDIKKSLDRHFRDTKKDVDGLHESKTESYEYKTGWWIFGSTHTATREFTAVRTGAVMNALDEMATNLETEVGDAATKIFKEWRKQLFGQLLSTLRANVEDESLLDDALIRNTIKRVCDHLQTPELEFSFEQKKQDEDAADDSKTPFLSVVTFLTHTDNSLGARGTVKNAEAEAFIDAAKAAITSLKKKLNRQIDGYADLLKKKLATQQFSSTIFTNYESEVERLKREISQQELTIARIDSLVRDLEALPKEIK